MEMTFCPFRANGHAFHKTRQPSGMLECLRCHAKVECETVDIAHKYLNLYYAWIDLVGEQSREIKYRISFLEL